MPENGNADQQNGTDGEQGGETPTWEGVLAGLPEDAQGLFAAHVAGLKSALESERGQRRTLAGELRTATGALKEGSEAREALEGLTGKLELAERRADFVTAAVVAGVRDVGLAWLAALELDAFDRKGEPDFVALKEAHPALFGGAAAGNAGSGTGRGVESGEDMDTLIRRRVRGG